MYRILALTLLSSLPTLASLEAATTVYVDQADDYTITTDQGSVGTLDAGDTVNWNGTHATVTDLTFGTNAFNSVTAAVNAVDAGGTVYIASGNYLEGAEITINKSLTLQGDGAELSILDGNEAHRVISITGSTTQVTINDLTIFNGGNGVKRGEQGGGIYNVEATLTINNSIFSENSVINGSGGGIYNAEGLLTINNSIFSGNYAGGGGGIYNTAGALTVNNTIFSGNSARGGGGGIYNFSSGTVTVSNSTLSGNYCGSGGGGIDNSGTLTVNHSTFSSNYGSDGGGIRNDVGGTVTISNSTLSGNTADGTIVPRGGAIYNRYDGTDYGTVTIINSTITGNSAARASGILGDATLINSIIAGNEGEDLAGTYTSEGINFIGTLLSTTINGSGTVLTFESTGTTIDELLAPLADNGGPTLTHALVAGSPAIDAGDNDAVPQALTTDQRGAERIRSNSVDIGAVESQPTPNLVSSSPVTGSTNLELDGSVTLTFDQDMQESTGAVILRHADDDSVIPSSVSILGDTVTITPLANFPEGTRFYIEIEADALTNLYNDAFAGISDSSALAFATCFSEVYVDQADDYTITTDQGSVGALDAGDTVTWHGTHATVSDLTFGSNAFTKVQDAIDAVCTTGTVYIAAGTYRERTEIKIDKDLTLQGDGADLTSLSGESRYQVIYISPPGRNSVVVEINDLAVIDGHGAPGIGNYDGTVTLNRLIISGNTETAKIGGGGIFNNEDCTMTINDSIVTNNESSAHGDGIYNYEGGTMYINNSTITRNDANGIANSGTLTINNSTISETNPYEDWIFPSIWNFSDGSLTLNNTIVAGNSGDTPDVADDGTATCTGVNFIGNPSSFAAFRDGTDLSFTSTNTTIDELLMPLADNGGTTPTHALVAGSPAINAGDNSTVAPLTTDQRGAERIRSGSVDIGAVETQPAPNLVSSSPMTGSANLELDGSVTLTFDQDIQQSTGAVILRHADDDSVIPSSVSILGDSVTITPLANFPEGTRFYIEIESDALTNLYNDAFAGISDSSALAFATCFSEVYVEQADDYTITTDQGSVGVLDAGDTVTWHGTHATVTDLTFGSNAFTKVQDAIDAVCTIGTVYIAADTYQEGAEITINKSLTLQGDGAELSILDGNEAHRVIAITGSTTQVTINDLTIVNGETRDGQGGGIYNIEATLTINNSIFSGNYAIRGGGIDNTEGSLTINNTIFSENSARATGGGINNNDILTINNCRFSKNGSSVGGSGINNESGTVTVNNSTLSGNSSSHGGGIRNNTGTLTVSNSTLSGNTAVGNGVPLGGGILNEGGTVTVSTSTLTGNSASLGDNIFSQTGTLTVRNSIIAGNQGVDIFGTATSEGVNFIGDPIYFSEFRDGIDLSFASTGTTIDELLAPLADNGGPTLTHALVAGSPALNTGDSSTVPPALTTDQRGELRVVGQSVDIGAFEVQNVTPVITLLGDNPLTLECGIDTFIDPGATASDDEDGNISNDIVVAGDTVDTTTLGTYTLTYNVLDSLAGAADEVTRTVNIVDTTIPVVTLIGGNIILQVGDTFDDPGATASDICDANVSVEVGGDSVDTSNVGSYTITYDATDSSDNAATQRTRTVQVLPAPVFSINANSSSISEGDTGTTNATFTITRSGTIDRSGSVNWSITPLDTLNAEDFTEISGTVDFAANNSSQTLNVQISGDNRTETDEAFIVTLSAAQPANALIAPANDSANGTIQNDDANPEAHDDGIYTVVEDGRLVVTTIDGVLANDTDTDDGNGPDHLTASVNDDVDNGTLTLNADGSFSYTPNPDFVGNDTFTYIVSDGSNSDSATVSLTVVEQADLSVGIEVLQNPIVAGGAAFDVFRITVVNNGPSDATGVQLTQSSTLPANINITNANTRSGGFTNGIWSIGALAEGASATLTLAIQASDIATSGSAAVPLAISLTSSDQPDNDPDNNTASAAVDLISATESGISVTMTPEINRQNGLLSSEVVVSNDGTATVPAFRLYVSNLPDDVSLYNRSGRDLFGAPAVELPYILYNQALAPGEQTTLDVQYYRPSLDTNFTPLYHIELLPFVDTVTAASSSGIDVERFLPLSNGDVLLEIASEPGSVYALEYTDDLADGFIRCTQTFTAAANRLQVIDSGSPLTATAPSDTLSRYYRFVLLSSPSR